MLLHRFTESFHEPTKLVLDSLNLACHILAPISKRRAEFATNVRSLRPDFRQLLKGDVDSRQLGHGTVEIPLRIYTQLLPGADNALAERVEKMAM
jgi:hypothetical protein